MHGVDVADRTIVQPLVALPVRKVVAPAEARHQIQVPLAGHTCRLEHAAQTGAVDGHRLLGEDVLARFDRRPHVGGAEVRGGGEDHHVDSAVDDLLVRVEARESTFFRHLRPPAGVRDEVVVARPQPIAEGVAHGPEHGALVGIQGLPRGAGASTSASDQSDLDGVVSTDPREGGGDHRDGTNGGGGCGDELAT